MDQNTNTMKKDEEVERCEKCLNIIDECDCFWHWGLEETRGCYDIYMAGENYG